MDKLEGLISSTESLLNEFEQACDSCRGCTVRCELLQDRNWDLRSFCVESRAALADVHGAQGLRQRLAEHAGLYRFVRTCLGCNRCTAPCPQGLSMSPLRAAWRNMLRASKYIPDEEVAGLFVDSTWDIFSAFRSQQGISYNDLPLLRVNPVDADANDTLAETPPQAATLFFPGCTLCSYAPELTRTAFDWLTEHEGPCLMATQCCASTLEGIGEGERARTWKRRVIEAARAQGVKRIVTVCPGCQLRLASVAAEVAPEIEFVSLARLLADADVRVQENALADCALPISVVDSCQDRAGGHGPAIRELFDAVEHVEFPVSGADAFCCGASGSVSTIDPRFTRNCTRHQLERGKQVGARTLITACPTCAYTYAFERLQSNAEGDANWQGIGSLNYLEAVFEKRIDWPATFQALATMWTSDHPAW